MARTGDGMPEVWDPGLAYSGLARAATRKPWVWVRVLFSGIWLVYLAQPLSSLSSHRSGAWLAAAIAVTVAFCVAFVISVITWSDRPRLAGWALAALVALAGAFSLTFPGDHNGGNVAWIFVASAAGWVINDRRLALRALAGIVAVYLLFSWLGHDSTGNILVTLIPVVFVALTMSGIKIQIRLLGELRQAREEVAQLAASEERLRLARDMHDLTGQSLSTITLKSELAARLLDRLPASQERDRVRDEIEQVAAVSRQTLRDIREAVSGYRKPTLAVEVVTARAALASAGITAHEDADLAAGSGTFGQDEEAALAWCLREAVTNVIRHSGARNCHISLCRKAGTMSLTVRDDGTGLRSAGCVGTATGSGLHGMAERLHAVGGRLELLPGDGGFRLVATAPERSTAPVQSAPVQSAPVQSAPVQSAPVQPGPVRPASVKGVGGAGLHDGASVSA
jgi:two-component system sensor histidine kinase DesK